MFLKLVQNTVVATLVLGANVPWQMEQFIASQWIGWFGPVAPIWASTRN
jgi:hypothetical protein